MHSYWNLIGIVWAHLALVGFSSFRAFYLRSQSPRPSLRWGFLVLVIGLVGLNVVFTSALLGSGFRAFQVPCSSVEDTIIPGDRIIVDCWSYRHIPPARGDLVVVRRTDVLIVKRVIAVEGDTIQSQDGVVAVNGVRLDEPYTKHTGTATPEMQTLGPLTIASGMLFVMGDNRDNSYDSRFTGPFSLSAVVAKPLYIYNFTRERRGKVLQ